VPTAENAPAHPGLTQGGSAAGLDVSAITAHAGGFDLGPIDLHVARGRVLVILGPSAAGKTVLLDTIAGFRSPDGGHVHLAGRDITALAPEQRRIGVVFQDAALFPHLTVAENVGFGPRAHGDHDPTRVAELLQRFGLTPLADRSPRSLSGGERQRAALARALAARPRLLLLDEPLSALDQPTRETLRGVLHDLLLGLDIPVVHVTHDRDEALTLAGDLAVIVGGRLRQLDAAQQVTTYPADPDVARLLGWTELGTGTVYNGHAVVGALRLVAPGHPDGSQTEICYRPEDVVLATAGHTDHSGRYTATVQQIVYTVPLARITLGPAPTITALVHRRDLYRLDLRMGETVEVLLPPTAIRLWPAANP